MRTRIPLFVAVATLVTACGLGGVAAAGEKPPGAKKGGPVATLQLVASATESSDGTITARAEFKSKVPACIPRIPAAADVSFLDLNDYPGEATMNPYPPGHTRALTKVRTGAYELVLPPGTTDTVNFEGPGPFPGSIMRTQRSLPVTEATQAIIFAGNDSKATWRVKAKLRGERVSVTCKGGQRFQIFAI